MTVFYFLVLVTVVDTSLVLCKSDDRELRISHVIVDHLNILSSVFVYGRVKQMQQFTSFGFMSDSSLHLCSPVSG